MEDILYNLRREKDDIDNIYTEINNCKEMTVPIDNDYVHAQQSKAY